MDVLNLSGADLKGFDAMESGLYPATVYEITLRETKGNPGAALPAGVPMWNVQFRIADGHEYENRRAFRSYTLAPSEIDGVAYEHKAKMDGMIARFLMDIGYSEAEITSGKFKPDFEDMVGRPVGVVLKRKMKYNTTPEMDEWDNEVVGTKPIDKVVAMDSATAGVI